MRSAVELLEARAAITDLVHGYAFYVRTRNPVACAALFTADATFETRRMVPGESVPQSTSQLNGRDAIAAKLTRVAQGEIGLSPMIHNLLIEVSGSEASSSCLMVGVELPNGTERIGEYLDTFRLEDGAWRFASRTHTMLLERVAGAGAKR